MAGAGIAALLSAGAAFAQDAAQDTAQPKGDETVEEVVVVGVRASVAKAVKLKRDASTVQDSISALELAFPIEFFSYFAPEIAALSGFLADALLTIDADWVIVAPGARLLSPAIGATFRRAAPMNLPPG